MNTSEKGHIMASTHATTHSAARGGGRPRLVPARLRVFGIAASVVAVTLLAAPAAMAEEEHVDLSVTIPAADAGAFLWAAPQSVSLGTATVQGAAFEATSSALVVNVTDTRLGKPAWSISGKATRFEHDTDGSFFSAAYLGWAPAVTTAGAGATAGPEAESGFDPADPLVPVDSATRGLNSGKVLASAELGHGGSAVTSAVITGHLTLRVPVTTPPGDYDSVLSLTATLGG